MTATDHETTVLDDLDFAPPCERPSCDHTAIWIERWRGLPCCAPTLLTCDQCLELAHKRLARAKATGFAACADHPAVLFSPLGCRIDAAPIDPNRPTGGLS